MNNPLSSADAADRLVIYLNDHRAMIAGEIAMAERCRTANDGTKLADDLSVHIREASADRDLLDEVIEAVGGSVDHVKTIAALAGERLGRFKLNGQLFGYSPLSRVIEIEGLLAASQARRSLWTSLQHDGPTSIDVDRIGERVDAVERQVDALDAHHRVATTTAFRDDATTGPAEG